MYVYAVFRMFCRGHSRLTEWHVHKLFAVRKDAKAFVDAKNANNNRSYEYGVQRLKVEQAQP